MKDLFSLICKSIQWKVIHLNRFELQYTLKKDFDDWFYQIFIIVNVPTPRTQCFELGELDTYM